MIAVAETLLKVVASQEAEIHKLQNHAQKLIAENQRVVEKITALEEKLNDYAFSDNVVSEPSPLEKETHINNLFKEMASQFASCHDYNTDWHDALMTDMRFNGTKILPFTKEPLVYFYNGFKIQGRFRDSPHGDSKEWRVCIGLYSRGKAVTGSLNGKLDDIHLYEAAKLIYAATH